MENNITLLKDIKKYFTDCNSSIELTQINENNFDVVLIFETHLSIWKISFDQTLKSKKSYPVTHILYNVYQIKDTELELLTHNQYDFEFLEGLLYFYILKKYVFKLLFIEEGPKILNQYRSHKHHDLRTRKNFYVDLFDENYNPLDENQKIIWKIK
jgi:hypothetical protein